MEVRELVAKLGFNYNGKGAAQFESSVGRIKTLAGNLGSYIKVALAGVTVAAVGHMIKSTIEYGDELNNTSRITGIAADQFERLRIAAKLANVDQGMLTSSLIIFSAKLAEAQAKGKGNNFDAFMSLGINPKKIKDTQEGFKLVSAALAGVQNQQKKVLLSRSLFGRPGGRLIPVFGSENSEEMKRYFAVLDAFGQGPGKRFAEQSDSINDKLDIMGEAWKRMRMTIVSAVYPAFEKMLDKMMDWILANKVFIKAQMQTAIKGLSVAFLALSRAIEYTVKFFELLFKMDQLDTFIAAILGIIAAFFPWLTLLSGIFLVLDDIFTYIRGGDSYTGDAINAMTAKWKQWKENILLYYDMIKAAAGVFIDSLVTKFDSFFDKMFARIIEMKNKLLDLLHMNVNDAASLVGSKISQSADTGILSRMNMGDILNNAASFGLSDMIKMFSGFKSAPSTNTFQSNPTININVSPSDSGDPQKLADSVKKVAQDTIREEYRTALRNLQSLENRGFA